MPLRCSCNWRKRYYQKTAESLGWDDRRPRRLRFSYGSMLVAEGHDPRTYVAQQLGNSPDVMWARYQGQYEDLDPNVEWRIDNAIAASEAGQEEVAA